MLGGVRAPVCARRVTRVKAGCALESRGRAAARGARGGAPHARVRTRTRARPSRHNLHAMPPHVIRTSKRPSRCLCNGNGPCVYTRRRRSVCVHSRTQVAMSHPSPRIGARPGLSPNPRRGHAARAAHSDRPRRGGSATDGTARAPRSPAAATAARAQISSRRERLGPRGARALAWSARGARVRARAPPPGGRARADATHAHVTCAQKRIQRGGLLLIDGSVSYFFCRALTFTS